MTVEIEKVFALFKLFYNEVDADEFLPVVTIAAERTEKRLVCGDDCDCTAVYYLAAAEALCCALEIKAARERLALTRTGAVPQEQDYSARLDYARQLYRSYEAACAGVIRDDSFIFIRMR